MSWTSLYRNLHILIFLGYTLKSGNNGCELSKVLQGEKKKNKTEILDKYYYLAVQKGFSFTLPRAL